MEDIEVIERYRNPQVHEIWRDENRLFFWQMTELAAIQAKEELGRIPTGTYYAVNSILMNSRFDLELWHRIEAEIRHDLQAFVEERRRLLPDSLKLYLHGDNMTSYDTEEPAFVRMLEGSVRLVIAGADGLLDALKRQALKYRYTIMNARTHGQEAELQTFGKRVLTWYQELKVTRNYLFGVSEQNLKYSKMSGAVGNYGGLDPEVERRALHILGLEPFYGATQIMPRVLYAPVAQGLANLVGVVNKIALDIRLMARSGNPLCQEPFGKKQKGSSAMPHKKNTITTEQVKGMERMARSRAQSICEGTGTWEERTIEQSCVERVEWPDLFHIAVLVIANMGKVITGLQVYPDNMLREVVNLRGCYASAEAKSILAKLVVAHGLTADDAYRIVQLAAFNVFEPDAEDAALRANPPQSLEAAGDLFSLFSRRSPHKHDSIRDVIAEGGLRPSPQLDHSSDTVAAWNSTLQGVFLRNSANRQAWDEVFDPYQLLRREDILFRQALGA